jgi:hypothetical protein
MSNPPSILTFPTGPFSFANGLGTPALRFDSLSPISVSFVNSEAGPDSLLSAPLACSNPSEWSCYVQVGEALGLDLAFILANDSDGLDQRYSTALPQFSFYVVPEPATAAMVSLGMIAAALRLRIRHTARAGRRATDR